MNLSTVLRVLVAGVGSELVAKRLFGMPVPGNVFQFDVLALEEANAVEDLLRKDKDGFALLILMENMVAEANVLNARELPLNIKVFGEITPAVARECDGTFVPVARAEMEDVEAFCVFLADQLLLQQSSRRFAGVSEWAQSCDPVDMATRYGGEWCGVNESGIITHSRYLSPVIKAIGDLRGISICYVAKNGDIYEGCPSHAHFE